MGGEEADGEGCLHVEEVEGWVNTVVQRRAVREVKRALTTLMWVGTIELEARRSFEGSMQA